MSNDDPNAPVGTPSPRRSPRQGIGGSPVGSTLSIVLAVVAVVVGFLILNNITDDGGSGAGDGSTDSTEPTSTQPPLETQPPESTDPPLTLTGATVIVANASGVAQSAAGMTAELTAAGFELGTPTNGTATGLTTTIVYYEPSIAAAQDVAESVATVMGGLSVETMPSPIPVTDGTLNGAGVLVMLGTDTAGKTLAELDPAAAPNVSAPDVAGTDTGTTAPP